MVTVLGEIIGIVLPIFVVLIKGNSHVDVDVGHCLDEFAITWK